MVSVILTFLTLSLFVFECQSSERNSSLGQCDGRKIEISHLRKRRHLTFPDKSNFVITLSLVKAFMTHAPAGWNTVFEVDVMFPLPDHTFQSSLRNKIKHRQRRDVWERIREAIELHNMNGRECILRIICEAREHLAPPGRSLAHDILRAIFTAPIHESDFQDELADYYEEFKDPHCCDRVHDCPISLLHYILKLNQEKIY
ncbi:uncharacterized protein LOC105385418 [Plutella xylostella]|uniref:uncharacterized protein LOC105385418 n=1 Tax=Plutella xylostella TaxID=51655 RepID=UPI002032C284|nr:uncharacterized protein LOC105385418 [Plutella xylostella]